MFPNWQRDHDRGYHPPPLRLLRQALGSDQCVKPFDWLVDLSLPGWSKAEFRVSGFCAVPTSDSAASSL